jgi:hypothetical protein
MVGIPLTANGAGIQTILVSSMTTAIAHGGILYQSEHVPYVIIIDDDESVRKAMKTLIRSLGHSVEAFGSAKAFLESNTIETASCLNHPCCVGRFSGVCFFHAGGAVNRR